MSWSALFEGLGMSVPSGVLLTTSDERAICATQRPFVTSHPRASRPVAVRAGGNGPHSRTGA